MAIKNRTTSGLMIHHSNRGLQYCSTIYQNKLVEQGIKSSMTDGYDCYQNTLVERNNRILKYEFFICKCSTGKNKQQTTNNK